jgi:hypothetical protein
VPGGEDGYEYVVGMRDEMAGPAKHAAAGLDTLTSALKSSEAAGHKHASLIGRVSGEHGKLSFAARESAGTLREFASDVLPGLVGIASVVGAMKLGFETIKFSINASEFKENAIAAYSIIKGTSEEGERTFAALDKTAREIHMPAERAHEIAQRLMLEGLESQKAVTDTVRAVGDLQRVGLEAGASKIQSIVERSVTVGHFEIGKGSKGLKGTGVTFDTLAAELGMGRKQFEQELKAGKISAETGIEAIDQVVLKGKVGALATKKFTISDAFVDMKNSIRSVFQESDASPLTSALQEVTGKFADGTKGAGEMKEAINDIIDITGDLVHVAWNVAEAFGKAWRAIKHGAEATYDWMEQHDPRTSPEQKRAANIRRELGDKLEDMRPLIDRRDEGISALKTASEAGEKPGALKNIAKKYGLEIAAGQSEVNSALDERSRAPVVDTVVAEAMGNISAAVTSMKPPSAGGAREPVNQSFGPQDDMHALGADAAGSVQEGWKDKNKQHSPSAVMYDLGADAADSLAAGAKAANASMVHDPPFSIRTPVEGGKRVHVDVAVGGIHFQGIANAEDFLPMLESQLADVFERVAIEMGE